MINKNPYNLPKIAEEIISYPCISFAKNKTISTVSILTAKKLSAIINFYEYKIMDLKKVLSYKIDVWKLVIDYI